MAQKRYHAPPAPSGRHRTKPPTSHLPRATSQCQKTQQGNLGTVRGTDPDGDKVTYSTSHGRVTNVASGRNQAPTIRTGSLNHETHSTITFKITATDPAGASDTASFKVTVTDVDETEQVTFSTNNPVVGSSVTATLSGGDDILSGPTWRWTRSGSSATIGSSSSYTPTTSDLAKRLTATATYRDTHRSGRTASAHDQRPRVKPPPHHHLLSQQHDSQRERPCLTRNHPCNRPRGWPPHIHHIRHRRRDLLHQQSIERFKRHHVHPTNRPRDLRHCRRYRHGLRPRRTNSNCTIHDNCQRPQRTRNPDPVNKFPQGRHRSHRQPIRGRRHRHRSNLGLESKR